MKWYSMFLELELFAVVTVNSKGTCEVGEKSSQEPNNVKSPFLGMPGPLKGLEVVKPGIPDLWTPASLPFPDRKDKPLIAVDQVVGFFKGNIAVDILFCGFDQVF